ncbi:hypothetical protein D5S17_16035 [Pseudonocardiaceae bacterium YIM PH 21723]|nr:hypothetical protein D5S17_16035 [Pseudonocardiaceae bacterium YIM PH 21723]
MSDGPVLYAEPGATWRPLLYAPAFAAVGIGLEALTGPIHFFGWAAGCGLLFVISALLVYAKRRMLAVRLTPTELQLGREVLPVKEIAELDEVGTPVGARVIGGWAVPRGTEELPLRLTDGQSVIAWARDPVALADALRRLVPQRTADS